MHVDNFARVNFTFFISIVPKMTAKTTRLVSTPRPDTTITIVPTIGAILLKPKYKIISTTNNGNIC